MPAAPSPPTLSSSAAHVLLPYASASAEACQAALAGLTLPNLGRLLAHLRPQPPVLGDDYTLNPPHEQALARTLGWHHPDGTPLPDGQLPWAAWQASVRDVPCAWFHPCHWQVGMEQVTLQPVDALQFSEAESHTLFGALAPLCAEDGITLMFERPDRWRAEGEVLRDLACASLDRVAHRHLYGWLPQGPAAPLLLRLQNEAQMLFYTHPVTDERTARGLLPINGIWISGSGSWHGGTPAQPWPVTQPDTLRQPALHGDWVAWANAWLQLDRDTVPDWLARIERKQTLHLTLCGERGYQSWHYDPSHRPGLLQRWRTRWGQSANPVSILKAL